MLDCGVACGAIIAHGSGSHSCARSWRFLPIVRMFVARCCCALARCGFVFQSVTRACVVVVRVGKSTKPSAFAV